MVLSIMSVPHPGENRYNVLLQIVDHGSKIAGIERTSGMLGKVPKTLKSLFYCIYSAEASGIKSQRTAL
jgi:hypothetical protein